MTIYVYYEGNYLVGSAKKPRCYIAYGEWDITDRLRELAWKTGEPVRI